MTYRMLGIVVSLAVAAGWSTLATGSPPAAGASSGPIGTLSAHYNVALPLSSMPVAGLRQRAVAGNAEAEAGWGLLLSNREDAADKRAAVKWFRKSALQGNSAGEFRLGLAYAYGNGVAQDVPEGLKWIRASTSGGSGAYMLVYGTVLGGLGGGSKQEIIKWIRKGAEAGSAEGMFLMATHDYKKEPVRARQWMLRAAETGMAFDELMYGWAEVQGTGMFTPGNVTAGLGWLRKSARQGCAPAEGVLAVLRMTGQDAVPKNAPAGVRWTRKAVAQHNALGYFALGIAREYGEGEPASPAKAWYDFAAARRLESKHELKNISEHMSLAGRTLSSGELARLQRKVDKLPLPKSQHGHATTPFAESP